MFLARRYRISGYRYRYNVLPVIPTSNFLPVPVCLLNAALLYALVPLPMLVIISWSLFSWILSIECHVGQSQYRYRYGSLSVMAIWSVAGSLA